MAKKMVVNFIYPPIPDRRFDYCAFYEGEEERGQYGYGSSKDEAISELLTDYPTDDSFHASHDMGR